MTAMPDNVIAELRKSYEDLTLSQKRIAELIVEDPQFVAFATVDKLASRLGVSASTVVRFAYRLGLDGYPELQQRVRDLVRTQLSKTETAPDGDVAITAALGTGELAASLEHDLANLRSTISRLTLRDLEQAVELLVNARAIYVIGGLASASLAQFMALALSRTRGDTHLLSGERTTEIVDVSSDDAVVAFSFPPYAVRTLHMVSSAKRQGARVVAITDTPLAPIAQSSDVTLSAHVSGIGLQNSLVAPMALANALLNAVVRETPAAHDRYAALFRLMNDWDTFLLRGDDA